MLCASPHISMPSLHRVSTDALMSYSYLSKVQIPQKMPVQMEAVEEEKTGDMEYQCGVCEHIIYAERTEEEHLWIACGACFNWYHTIILCSSGFLKGSRGVYLLFFVKTESEYNKNLTSILSENLCRAQASCNT